MDSIRVHGINLWIERFTTRFAGGTETLRREGKYGVNVNDGSTRHQHSRHGFLEGYVAQGVKE